jgi:hypothetical protein
MRWFTDDSEIISSDCEGMVSAPIVCEFGVGEAVVPGQQRTMR